MPYVLVILALGLLTAFAVGLKIDDGTTHAYDLPPVDLHPSPVEGANSSYAYVATTTTEAPVTSTTVLTRKARSELFAAATGRCGGDLPPCWVMMRESGGDIHAYNPTGCANDRLGPGCFGKWQCSRSTCDGTGTEEEQDAEARRVWDGGRGCHHWSACGNP